MKKYVRCPLNLFQEMSALACSNRGVPGDEWTIQSLRDPGHMVLIAALGVCSGSAASLGN